MGSGSSKPSNSVGSSYAIPGAVSTASYTVATPRGQKLALIIGINYTGTDNELRGCINDANKVNSLLSGWGFTCTVMTNLSAGNLYSSKSNILNKMDTLLSGLGENDTLIIYYSGHGSLVNDNNGDEVYGKDSVIVPDDYSTAGFIIDDEIRQKLMKATQGNVMCFFDSCNSGSVCDLRYSLLSNVYRTILSNSRLFNPTEWARAIETVVNDKYAETNTNILSLSGSRDDQLSYEIRDSSGAYGGALTFAVLSILKSNTPAIKMLDFVGYVRSQILSWGLSNQTPSLMSGKAFTDENLTVAQYIGI